MACTVADQMVEVLAAAGVKRNYGVIGDSLNRFADALRLAGGVTAEGISLAAACGIDRAQCRG